MQIFITSETGEFIITEDGDFLTLDFFIVSSVRQEFTVLPRIIEFETARRTIGFDVQPRTIRFEVERGGDMVLKISPKPRLDKTTIGEDYAYRIGIARELGDKTVESYLYEVFDSSGNDVTSTFGGGSSYSNGSIMFGVKAVSAGTYTLKFTVTCDQVLPDGVTPYKFYPIMTVKIA